MTAPNSPADIASDGFRPLDLPRPPELVRLALGRLSRIEDGLRRASWEWAPLCGRIAAGASAALLRAEAARAETPAVLVDLERAALVIEQLGLIAAGDPGAALSVPGCPVVCAFPAGWAPSSGPIQPGPARLRAALGELLLLTVQARARARARVVRGEP